jgi:hypothetical protein
MALDTIPKQEGGKLKAVASGTLPSGQPVVVNADGTVSVVEGTSISEAIGSETVFEADSTLSTGCGFDSNSNKVVIAYRDFNNSSYGTAVVGTVSGTSISFGTPVVFNATGSTNESIVVFDSLNNKIVIVYQDGGNSAYGTAIVGTVSGDTISFGSPTVFISQTLSWPSATFDTVNNRVVISYADNGNSVYGTAIVGTVSGTSISFGSSTVFESADTDNTAITFDSSNNKVVVAYQDAGNSNYGTAVVGTVSGTSISFGTPVVFESQDSDKIAITFDSASNKVVVVYQDDGGDNSRYGTAIVGTVSGTSISFGSPSIFESANTDSITASFDSNVNKVVIQYRDGANSNYGTIVFGTVNGNAITFTSPTVFNTANTGANSSVFDSNSNKVIVAYQDAGNSAYGTAIAVQAPGSVTNLTSENYIGMSGGAVSGSPQSVGSAVVFESAEADQMSAVYDTNSQKVVIAYRDRGNSNYGTAIVGTVSGTSISFGTAVVFESASSYDFAVTYDTNSQKIVVAYTDGGNSTYGTAIVGTVSGTSISFGSAAVFKTANASGKAMTYDSNLQKIVVAYRDLGNSDQGSCNVGTVSGTSISFGSDVVFEAASTNEISATFDSNSNKVVISYSDEGNSNYGTAIVGTVSGTSISFGTAVVFEAATATQMSSAFDSSSNKVVVAYKDAGNSFFGTAIVGTVSGTSISFGTAAVFQESNTNDISAVFDPSTNKVVIAYQDGGDSDFGKVIEGTVSGTSVSFGSALTFESSKSEWISAAYDTASQKTVIAYQDDANSQYGNAIVFQADTITRGEVADGDNAVVDIVGTVSTNQVGLTAGQQYYVQTDGTVGTTPADPSVLAGTAISATKMLVKT